LTKLVIDYPVKYTSLSQGDITFVLAHLYLKNSEYKHKIDELKVMGRELMLDNGAWEFGSSMPPLQYEKIIAELEPNWAVIPDVYKNRWQSEKVTEEFIELHDNHLETELMFVPQGTSVVEVIESYNSMVDKHGMFFDCLAIAKHIGSFSNRISFTDLLYVEATEPPVGVHFLGFWNWREFEELKMQPWHLWSVDTKKPVKNAFLPDTFTSQLDYYNTDKDLDENAFNIEVNDFYVNLAANGWLE
jgi:hypothetical protein